VVSLIRASHKKRAPDPDADRGALGFEQLDHRGYRKPVPAKKSL